jgi:flagellar L-ring protein precursor FlgH
MKNYKLLSGILLLSTALGGCASTLDRLDEIGKPPKMAEVTNPTEQANYRPMTWPMPENQPPPRQYANSLWQPGARAFFRDQRAARVGDILRVNVKIEDKAELDNETERKRDSTDSLAAPAVFGLQNRIFGPLPGKANPSKLLSVNGATNSKGNGSVKRKETIETQIAALITQVLPNGNFVIDGKQEMRVNYEIREVAVKGVVRPEDIKSDNTIDSSQIAEARIVYGGRGQLSDMQQPRWGSQVVEALAPF